MIPQNVNIQQNPFIFFLVKTKIAIWFIGFFSENGKILSTIGLLTTPFNTFIDLSETRRLVKPRSPLFCLSLLNKPTQTKPENQLSTLKYNTITIERWILNTITRKNQQYNHASSKFAILSSFIYISSSSLYLLHTLHNSLAYSKQQASCGKDSYPLLLLREFNGGTMWKVQRKIPLLRWKKLFVLTLFPTGSILEW